MITRRTTKGFTLIELVVSVGLFAIVMLLASGAYLVMINLNRQAQAITIGVNNLSFALETMVRTIRTSTTYSCNGGGDCSYTLGGGTTFSVKNSAGIPTTYSRATLSSKGYIAQNGVALTDVSTVSVTSLVFYVTGTATATAGEYTQPYVTIIVKGSVSSGPGKTQTFSIETGAAMRGSDLAPS